MSVPVIGEPPVFLGSNHVRVAESWRILMTCGGGGESGTSGEIFKYDFYTWILFFCTFLVHSLANDYKFSIHSLKGCLATIGSDFRPSPIPYLFSALTLKMYSVPSWRPVTLKLFVSTDEDTVTHMLVMESRFSRI